MKDGLNAQMLRIKLSKHHKSKKIKQLKMVDDVNKCDTLTNYKFIKDEPSEYEKKILGDLWGGK